MHFDPPIVLESSCFLSGPLLSHSLVVYFDSGHPCFRNFTFTIPVDVIRVKSYVDSFLDPMCVPVRISINKVDLIPDRIVADLVGVFRNSGGLGINDALQSVDLLFLCTCSLIVGIHAAGISLLFHFNLS